MALQNATGSDVESLSEGLFCIYFAIWKVGGAKKTEYLADTGPKSWIRVWSRGVGSTSQPIDSVSRLNAWANYMGISRIVSRVLTDPAFTRRINKIHNYITDFPRGRTGLWHSRLVDQQTQFWSSRYTNFTGGSFIAMRADAIPARYDPYKVYEIISRRVQSNTQFNGRLIDKDKWNPSDVWIFAPSAITALVPFKTNLNSQILAESDAYKVGYIGALNNKIWDLYQQHKLYPVSLKAPGASVQITAENQKEGSRQYDKVIRYTGVEYSRNNQDAKLGFSVDLYDNRARQITERDYLQGIIKVKTATITGMGSGGGSRLEIEVRPAGGAIYGSLGTDLQRIIIEETDNTGIQRLQRIRNRFNGNQGTPDLWGRWWRGQNNWLGREAYTEAVKEDEDQFVEDITPYVNALYAEINSGVSTWDPPQSMLNVDHPGKVWLSKAHAGEIAVAVEGILNDVMKDITMENLFNTAASQKVQTGTSMGQLKRRLKTMDNRLKEDLREFPPAKANLIWNSCFYLVVK